jgi:hypothetical protein
LGQAGVPFDRTAEAAVHFTPLPPAANGGASPPTRTHVLRTDVERSPPSRGAASSLRSRPASDRRRPRRCPRKRSHAPACRSRGPGGTRAGSTGDNWHGWDDGPVPAEVRAPAD